MPPGCECCTSANHFSTTVLLPPLFSDFPDNFGRVGRILSDTTCCNFMSRHCLRVLIFDYILMQCSIDERIQSGSLKADRSLDASYQLLAVYSVNGGKYQFSHSIIFMPCFILTTNTTEPSVNIRIIQEMGHAHFSAWTPLPHWNRATLYAMCMTKMRYLL